MYMYKYIIMDVLFFSGHVMKIFGIILYNIKHEIH